MIKLDYGDGRRRFLGGLGLQIVDLVTANNRFVDIGCLIYSHDSRGLNYPWMAETIVAWSLGKSSFSS